MHPPQVRAEALVLVDQGHNDCEISRRLGVPRRTILDWRRPTYVPREPAIPRETCPRCWRVAKPMRFTRKDYAELLGFYLGDGWISDLSRTQRLRIALDTKYPKIVASAKDLLSRCFPHNPVSIVPYHDGACVYVSIYSSHLGCLLPQHGPGKKHERPIKLEPWQHSIIEAEPWTFIRACIWTDGCAFVNRTDIHRPEPYEYLSYQFSNKSEDIAGLLVGACELVGIHDYRLTFDRRRELWSVRINRRGSVALMLEHVGLKE